MRLQSTVTPQRYVIAVIGAASCGKTTAIRKGLKPWGLSDETVLGVMLGPAGLDGRGKPGCEAIRAFEEARSATR